MIVPKSPLTVVLATRLTFEPGSPCSASFAAGSITRAPEPSVIFRSDVFRRNSYLPVCAISKGLVGTNDSSLVIGSTITEPLISDSLPATVRTIVADLFAPLTLIVALFTGVLRSTFAEVPTFEGADVSNLGGLISNR